LTRSGLMYPEVSSKVYHDSFCQLGSSISLPCSGPVTHSGEILTTGKSHGKKPDRFTLNDNMNVEKGKLDV